MVRQDLHRVQGQQPWAGDTRVAPLNGAATEDVYAIPPKGHMSLLLPAGKVVRLRLAHQWFRLRRVGEQVHLDAEGVERVLRPGENIIGRAADADVRVAIDCQDVSRHHAVVDVRDSTFVVLTDTSSCGTYLGREAFFDQENWSG